MKFKIALLALFSLSCMHAVDRIVRYENPPSLSKAPFVVYIQEGRAGYKEATYSGGTYYGNRQLPGGPREILDRKAAQQLFEELKQQYAR